MMKKKSKPWRVGKEKQLGSKKPKTLFGVKAEQENLKTKQQLNFFKGV